MKFEKIAAIVPVFNPEPGLLELCRGLTEEFQLVVVVDDGSYENCEKFSKLDEVHVLRHPINQGKGNAIKTGIAWVREFHPDVSVIVFADGDGQHRLCDIRAVAMHTLETKQVTFGVRTFDTSVPLRSRFGNVLTSFLVRLMFRIKIYDTQTGLRAIPAHLFSEMLRLPGQRYEYEMQIFGLLRERKERLEQVPIETIYIENNRASHFRPIVDSYRIYKGLFAMTLMRFVKFSLSSIVGFVTDNAVFTVALYAFHGLGMLRRYDILASLVLSRIVSATVNYLCNRKFVFHAATRTSASFGRYWCLVLLIAFLSYVGTATCSALLDAKGILIVCVKVTVETILFLLSYKLQKVWVFA